MFEIVTKERVYKLVALSQPEMVAWVKNLSPATTLHTENGLFFQAENLIQHAAKQRAMSREKELLASFHAAAVAASPNSTSNNTNTTSTSTITTTS
jgi:hypothetical protein